MATDPRSSDVVGRLGCLRGVGTLTAFALCVEIGDWHRLTGATIGAYLGLTPSESQSGARHTRGPITKAGNSHARRPLVEAAWHHRGELRTSVAIEARRAGQRPQVRARAEQAGDASPPLVPTGAPAGCALHDRRHGRRQGARRLVLESCRDGLASSATTPGRSERVGRPAPDAARGDARYSYEQPYRPRSI